jgi:hypothetical protein
LRFKRFVEVIDVLNSDFLLPIDLLPFLASFAFALPCSSAAPSSRLSAAFFIPCRVRERVFGLTTGVGLEGEGGGRGAESIGTATEVEDEARWARLWAVETVGRRELIDC